MSKQKIDQTTTQARNARAKKARTVTHEEPAEEKPVEVPQAKPKRGKKAEPKAEVKPPKEELVVFALRMAASDRDALHRAAGPAKATRFARALLIAASKGDEKTLVEIARAVKAS